jgi:hydrogenase nickel incorporation protein HypA/HybF
MSLMRDLMRKIQEVAGREGGGRVLRVDIWLGALSHMSPEHFAEHFAEVSGGTVAEGAKLSVETSDDIHDPHAQSILFRGLEMEPWA